MCSSAPLRLPERGTSMLSVGADERMAHLAGGTHADRSERPPGVLFVASCWYPDEGDPANGIFVRRHAEAVAGHCRVVVLAPTASHDRRSACGRVADEEGLATARVRLPPGRRPWSDAQLAIRAVSAARAAATWLGGVDVVHYNVAPSAALYAGVSLALGGVPHVLTEHWSGYLPSSTAGMGAVRRALVRRIVRRAAFVTTVSGALRDAMSNAGLDGEYVVVPNTVDAELFCPGTDGLRRRRCERWVAVARASAEKNLGGIIEVFDQLRDRRPGLQLHIHGDGPDLVRLHSRVERAGLGGVVFLHGAGAPRVVAASMAAADALVLFSHWENSPCVLGEAMACGLPVVAPDVGGVPELVPPHCGVLVPPRDVGALRAAVERLASSGERFDREVIRDEAVTRFSYAAVGAQFRSLYRSISR